jgi:hypothetical protein
MNIPKPIHRLVRRGRRKLQKNVELFCCLFAPWLAAGQAVRRRQARRRRWLRKQEKLRQEKLRVRQEKLKQGKLKQEKVEQRNSELKENGEQRNSEWKEKVDQRTSVSQGSNATAVISGSSSPQGCSASNSSASNSSASSSRANGTEERLQQTHRVNTEEIEEEFDSGEFKIVEEEFDSGDSGSDFETSESESEGETDSPAINTVFTTNVDDTRSSNSGGFSLQKLRIRSRVFIARLGDLVLGRSTRRRYVAFNGTDDRDVDPDAEHHQCHEPGVASKFGCGNSKWQQHSKEGAWNSYHFLNFRSVGEFLGWVFRCERVYFELDAFGDVWRWRIVREYRVNGDRRIRDSSMNADRRISGRSNSSGSMNADSRVSGVSELQYSERNTGDSYTGDSNNSDSEVPHPAPHYSGTTQRSSDTPGIDTADTETSKIVPLPTKNTPGSDTADTETSKIVPLPTKIIPTKFIPTKIIPTKIIPTKIIPTKIIRKKTYPLFIRKKTYPLFIGPHWPCTLILQTLISFITYNFYFNVILAAHLPVWHEFAIASAFIVTTGTFWACVSQNNIFS